MSCTLDQEGCFSIGFGFPLLNPGVYFAFEDRLCHNLLIFSAKIVKMAEKAKCFTPEMYGLGKMFRWCFVQVCKMFNKKRRRQAP